MLERAGAPKTAIYVYAPIYILCTYNYSDICTLSIHTYICNTICIRDPTDDDFRIRSLSWVPVPWCGNLLFTWC